MGIGAMLVTGGALAAAPFEWQIITPADAGFVPDLDARLVQLVADKRAWGLHGVVVARKGKLVLERASVRPGMRR
jgi:hypothetical protein